MKDWEVVEDNRYSYLYNRNYGTARPMKVVEYYKLPAQCKVLDIGCGLGALAEYFEDYTGLDVSEVAINKAKAKYPNARFYHLPISDLNLIEEEFDAVLCVDVMEHLPLKEIRNTLASISRIPSGCYIFSISCRKAGNKDQHGEQVHRTVRDQQWWLNALSGYFGVVNWSDLNPKRGFYCICEALDEAE